MQSNEKKLKYERLNNMDNVIIINLHNYYEVVALIGKDSNNDYDVQLMLKPISVDTWVLVEDAEHIILSRETKNVYSDILKTIDVYLQNGLLDYYIKRYEYELKCFDLGNEIEESQSDWSDTK